MKADKSMPGLHVRYERKFQIARKNYAWVAAILRSHPALFKKAYEPRWINNIYFDNFGLSSYVDHVQGENRRVKVRVRWYGPLVGPVGQPQLEWKIKNNQQVSKIIYPLQPFHCDRALSLDAMRQVLRQSELPGGLFCELLNLNFSLCTRYRRNYFISMDRQYRVTVDTDLQFYGLSPQRNYFLNCRRDRDNSIIELKYPLAAEAGAEQITGFFPFRLGRCSKYVKGVNLLAGWA